MNFKGKQTFSDLQQKGEVASPSNQEGSLGMRRWECVELQFVRHKQMSSLYGKPQVIGKAWLMNTLQLSKKAIVTKDNVS